MSIFSQLMTAVKFVIVVGLLSAVLGEALPRRWFHWDRFPYGPFRWEKSGKFYEIIRIRKWKDRLPDKSRHARHTFRKQMEGHTNPENLVRFLQETCVAELVHGVLVLLSGLLYCYIPTPFGLFLSILYGLSNIPFMLIQRYNRPRLLRLLQRQRQKEQKGA